MKKYIKYICAILLVIGTSAHAWSAETSVATFVSYPWSEIGSGYTDECEDENWYLSIGGGSDRAGFNKNNHRTIGNNFGTGANASHHGWYMRSKKALTNVCKITFTYTQCSTAAECDNARMYLAYSTNGSTWSAVTLTSGTQGMNVGPNDDGGDGLNTAVYTMEFNKIASAYYAVIISRNGSVTDGQGFAFSHTTIDFIGGCCDKIVTPAKGTRTNCEIAFSPEEVATCSSTAADRRVTVSVTPNSCYAAPLASSITTSGTTCTKISGPTQNGDKYDYVYEFAQNATGTTTFSCSLSTKETYTVNYNKGTYGTGTNTSATKTCGVDLTLPGATFTRTGYTQAGWSTSAAGTSKAYNLSGSYTTDAGTTLYPYWTANTISITLDKNEGDADGSASVKYDATSLTSISHATRSEWNVVGYYAEPACTNKVLTNTGLLVNYSGYVEGGKWVRATTPTTLYAKWSKTQYTVTFDMNGHGDAVPAQEVESGDPAVRPTPDPSADDWRFLGWYDAASGGSEWNFSTAITVNTTIHAHWEAISYNTETYKAWCEPNISFSGDIHLTSVNGVSVYSTSTTNNLLHIISDDLAGVNKLEISYLDADNGDAVVASASSLFRLCSAADYNVADGSQIDVSGSNTCDLTYSIRYTPNTAGVTNHYKIQIAMKRGSGASVWTVKTATYDVYGRSLPVEFVVASKFNGEWYALPNTLAATEAEAKAVEGIKITVDNTTTPTKAVYAPNTAVYQGDGRYAPESNVYGIRLTDGTNHLQVSSTASVNYMWLSPTGSAAHQDWWLNSSNFGAYSVTIPSNTGNESKKIGMYGGNIGYYASPTSPSGQIYFLPIQNKLIDVPASVTEWGQHSVILDVDAQTASSASARLGAGSSENAASFGQTKTSVKNSDSKYNYTLNFNTIDFSAHKGELLYIDWLDGEDNVIGTSQINIPWIIASSGTMSTIDGTKAHWNTEVHVLPGATLTANGGSFGSSSVTIKQLEIYPGAIVKVTTGTLAVTDLVLRYGWTRAGEKSYDVAQMQIKRGDGGANLTTSHAYADWYIDYDQYYPISVPWTVTVANMSYKNSNSAASAGVKLRYYDGESRATNGQSGVDEGANWKEYSPLPATLEPSKGYAMSAKRPSGKAFSIVRMPLTIPSASWTALGEQGEVSGVHKNQVSVTGYGYGSSEWYAMGWNFIGNPYMSTFNGDDEGISGKLELQSGGTIRYATIPDLEFRNYYQVNIAEANLKPASGFFVQANNASEQTITFAANKIVAPSAPARYTKTQEVAPEQEVYIRLSDEEEMKDQMGIIIGEDYTEAYEPNADLVKVLGEANTLKTYMHYTEMDMAYVAINKQLAKEWIPVTVHIPSEGDYTFSLTNASVVEHLEGVYLMDYKYGIVTNLIGDTYTFHIEEGITDNRFAINAIVGIRQTPTGIDALDSKNDGSPVKFIYRDNVYIRHNGVIYDATGKRVK